MGTVQGQLWKSSNFTIAHTMGSAPGTVIFRFSGPFTARDMYTSLTPSALKTLFDLPSQTQAKVHIFDLTEVPYMDSTGLGLVVTHFARCKNKGVGMVLAGVRPHVLQLLQLTKTDKLIPMTDGIEEADSGRCD